MRTIKTLESLDLKHGDTNKTWQLRLLDDGVVTPLTGLDTKVRIKNESGYLLELPSTINGGIISVSLNDEGFKKLPVGQYDMQVDVTDSDELVAKYPTNGFVSFSINRSADDIVGEAIPTISIEDIKKQVELDILAKIKNGDFSGERHGPSSYSLDRTGNLWVIHYDNGCDLYLNYTSYGNNEAVYGLNNNNVPFNNKPGNFGIPAIAIQLSTGSIGVKYLKDIPGDVSLYFGSMAGSSRVVNPVNLGDDLNYDNCKPTKDALIAPKSSGANFVKIMYQLAAITKQEAISLGAVAI